MTEEDLRSQLDGHDDGSATAELGDMAPSTTVPESSQGRQAGEPPREGGLCE